MVRLYGYRDWRHDRKTHRRGHRNVTIQNDRIEDWNLCAISVDSVVGARIVGNTITNNELDTFTAPYSYGIRIQNAEDVLFSGNVIEDKRPMNGPLLIEGVENFIGAF